MVGVIKETHYGDVVSVNTKTESTRKENCLCLNCTLMYDCVYAKQLFGICKSGNIALMVTRCRDFLECNKCQNTK